MVDVGDDDLAELQLEQADLLAQDDREQQVEGPGEDVEVEIEVGDRHRVRLEAPLGTRQAAVSTLFAGCEADRRTG